MVVTTKCDSLRNVYIVREFAAFTASFDSDDNNNTLSDLRRILEWVVRHLKGTRESCLDSVCQKAPIFEKDVVIFPRDFGDEPGGLRLKRK